MREAQPYIDAVWQFLASVGVMSWLGWWADGRLGTKPWLLLTGVLLGFAAAIWGFIKVLMHRNTPPNSTRDDSNDGPRDGAKR